MECTGERKREGGRVDMPTTKWRAGCACERLSKFSKCREREREKVVGAKHTHSRERERFD